MPPGVFSFQKIYWHTEYSTQAIIQPLECLPEQLAAVALDDYKARIERIVHIYLVVFDWNCPQHITRRYTPEEFEALAQAGE